MNICNHLQNSSSDVCCKCGENNRIYIHTIHPPRSGFYCRGLAEQLKLHELGGRYEHYIELTKESNQSIDIKSYPCKNGCGAMIKFDNKQMSKGGKSILLELDDTPHLCPKAPKSTCKYCRSEITFEQTSTGRWFLNTSDSTFHPCPNWPGKMIAKRQEHPPTEETG